MGSGIRVRRQGDYGVSRRDTPCRIAVGSGRHDDGTKLAFDEQDSQQNTPLALPGKREDEKTKTKIKTTTKTTSKSDTSRQDGMLYEINTGRPH